MTIGDLVMAARTLAPEARAVAGQAGVAARRVSGVAHDSRAVSQGTVFVAIRGQRADGATFVRQAVTRGAIAIVAETAPPEDVTVPWLRTTNARLTLADLSSLFYGQPSHDFAVVGVTGTNGKTTTTYLLASVFDAAGMPCGRMGTVTVKIGQEERDAAHTTPEAPEVQRLLREMVDHGAKACAMEVSSHALVLERVAFVRFAAGIFTNLTRDHLDFHRDMQQYFDAKRRLFDALPPDAPAILNVDDPRGRDLVKSVARPVTYAIDQGADVRPRVVHASLEGLAFEVETPRGVVHVRSPLVGRPNVYNILSVVATATALDVPIPAIEKGLAQLDGVPGRFQIVSAVGDHVRVVVDYAHTDDALKNLLETARPLTSGQLITVFGCGGDRDATKRPLMGAVAARLSDLVVITSDNPRSEDAQQIIDEIKRGIVPARELGGPARATPQHTAIVDRRLAIEYAIRIAQPGDLVLVAGKGHEKYQVIGDRTLPFDDVEVARAALAGRRAASKV